MAGRANFKQETILKLLQMQFKDEKTRVSGDAQKVMTTLMQIYVSEAAARAAKQAKNEGTTVVGVDHFEKILPQLMLDF
ncbi:centromere protein X-like [Lingula anatina]|uniref:Centromere protein X n=1 Tax=Lingula anatina TaxID=7574 RepID=A0A1S3IDE9_LINAN|nr:centromere protein X-like [Lingula anatina]XP_013395464.1 centromere protein X-like [Lingula anatina]|eukprot:XP_013392285.1 centromere protein X-like [Lingula anatina]